MKTDNDVLFIEGFTEGANKCVNSAFAGNVIEKMGCPITFFDPEMEAQNVAYCNGYNFAVDMWNAILKIDVSVSANNDPCRDSVVDSYRASTYETLDTGERISDRYVDMQSLFKNMCENSNIDSHNWGEDTLCPTDNQLERRTLIPEYARLSDNNDGVVSEEAGIIQRSRYMDPTFENVNCIPAQIELIQPVIQESYSAKVGEYAAKEEYKRFTDKEVNNFVEYEGRFAKSKTYGDGVTSHCKRILRDQVKCVDVIGDDVELLIRKPDGSGRTVHKNAGVFVNEKLCEQFIIGEIGIADKDALTKDAIKSFGNYILGQVEAIKNSPQFNKYEGTGWYINDGNYRYMDESKTSGFNKNYMKIPCCKFGITEAINRLYIHIADDKAANRLGVIFAIALYSVISSLFNSERSLTVALCGLNKGIESIVNVLKYLSTKKFAISLTDGKDNYSEVLGKVLDDFVVYDVRGANSKALKNAKILANNNTDISCRSQRHAPITIIADAHNAIDINADLYIYAGDIDIPYDIKEAIQSIKAWIIHNIENGASVTAFEKADGHNVIYCINSFLDWLESRLRMESGCGDKIDLLLSTMRNGIQAYGKVEYLPTINMLIQSVYCDYFAKGKILLREGVTSIDACGGNIIDAGDCLYIPTSTWKEIFAKVNLSANDVKKKLDGLGLLKKYEGTTEYCVDLTIPNCSKKVSCYAVSKVLWKKFFCIMEVVNGKE